MISSVLSAFLAAFLLQGTASSSTAQRLSQIIESVSKNVKEFQELLPDFVCHETITSVTYKSGIVNKRMTVESTFTALQKPGTRGVEGARPAFTESREITEIDGKPVRKGTKMPRLPVQFTGGFSSVLVMTFSPENLKFHRYGLDSRSADTGPVLVSFATKEDQDSLQTFFDGELLVDRDRGKALIDTSAMQVLRLQRDFLALPKRLRNLTNTVEYGPSDIGGREFWLPRTIRTDGVERDPKNTESYLAAYSDCKRFVADIKLVPQ